jgi:hypothetical protein
MPETTPISAEHRRRFWLFNEQADVLLQSSFAAAMFDQGPVVVLRWEEGGALRATGAGPDAEAMRAFALTFRMFFRDGDGISFREMAEIYEDASIPMALRESFREARDSMNRFLDAETMFNFNGETITNRRLLEVFLYGGHAHMNPEKRAAYEAWRQVPVAFMLMEKRFDFTLAQVCSCIRSIRELNLHLLRGDGTS